MFHPVCGMMHVKEPLWLIKKSSPCGGSGFPLSLSGPLPCVRCHITVNKNVLSASLNKTFLSLFIGARCSSLVRAFAHGAMGHQMDPLWWTH